MVGYVKQHFFVRYREFESWSHLNQLAERWLTEEADQRMHGTVHEVVAERFAREATALYPLPRQRFDTSYRETRQVAWDGYVDVRGNRYPCRARQGRDSVPAELAGSTVVVRIGLNGTLRVYAGETLVARHRLRPARSGWVTVPEHHAELWRKTLGVERRPLEVYAEAAQWN